MLRKQLNIFAFIVASLLFSSSEQIYARYYGAGQQTGILWQIERPGLRPSFIFGTIHSDDSRVINLAEIIRQKLRQADSFVAEIKMDSFSIQEGRRLMFLRPVRHLCHSLANNAISAVSNCWQDTAYQPERYKR